MEKTKFKDIEGKEIFIGDYLQTKWGGVGKVVKQGQELLILFESGNYPVILDEDCIEYRGLVKQSFAKKEVRNSSHA